MKEEPELDSSFTGLGSAEKMIDKMSINWNYINYDLNYYRNSCSSGFSRSSCFGLSFSVGEVI